MTVNLVQKDGRRTVESQQGLELENSTTRASLAAYAAIAGTVTMLAGAALWGTSGTDLWAALDTGDMAGYLQAAGAVRAQLVANLIVWIVGVLILGFAGTMLAQLPTRRPALADAALLCYRTAVPLAIISYIAMLAVVVQIAPDSSPMAVTSAEIVGWLGARADDLATALILGPGLLFFSIAGKETWAPGWLVVWGYVAGLVSLLSLVFAFIPGMAALGFLILPVGMGWLLAAGVVLLRHKSD
jgi:hypothetical protein